MANWGDNSFQEETKFAHAKREMEDCKEREKEKADWQRQKTEKEQSKKEWMCLCYC